MAFDARILGTLIPLIMAGIQSAEGLKGATGPKKKAHALTLVQVGLSTLEAVYDRDLIDDASVVTAVDAGIDAVVGVINAVEQVKAGAPAA